MLLCVYVDYIYYVDPFFIFWWRTDRETDEQTDNIIDIIEIQHVAQSLRFAYNSLAQTPRIKSIRILMRSITMRNAVYADRRACSLQTAARACGGSPCFCFQVSELKCCLGVHELFDMFWCCRRGAIHHTAEAARYKHINNAVPAGPGLTRGLRDPDAAKSIYLIDVFVYHPVKGSRGGLRSREPGWLLIKTLPLSGASSSSATTMHPRRAQPYTLKSCEMDSERMLYLDYLVISK